MKVADNGRGIPADRMERIQQSLERLSGHDSYAVAERNGEFFGLLNVKARILIYYGETARFTLESVEGVGTTAVLDIPVECCREHMEGE
ncbi:hypothetical protein D3C73_1516740 [compost metagenome]